MNAERMIWDPPADRLEETPRQNPDGLNLRVAALDWIEDNPEAYALFRRFAAEKLRIGKPFGIGELTERVRWEAALHTWGDAFKVNNNFRAYIARALCEEIPGLERLMRFRRTQW